MWQCRVCGADPDLAKDHFPLTCVCGSYYEKWEKPRSVGLGDTIAKVTSAVGLRPCGGCKKRQAKLNRLVPYRKRK